MKIQTTLRFSATVSAIAAAVAIFTGCASTPADRAAEMSKSTLQTGKALERSSQAISECLTALNELITQPKGDMRGQYKNYRGSVKSLGQASDKMDANINEMMDAGRVYFADWDNQIAAINDPALKKLSQDRKEQAVTSLDELKKSIDQMRAAYKPLTKDLDDIGLYLGNNLTADGIAAMKPRQETVKTQALSVRNLIASSVSALNKFSASLSTPSK